MRNTGTIVNGLRRRAGGFDAALAAVVLAVVPLMILPLPTPLLDVLLACNLAVSISILLVVLYVPDALRVISPAELLPEIALETWAVATVTNL
jgi:type III secretion protein V